MEELPPADEDPVPHDDPASPESRLLGAPVQSVPDRVRAASPMTYVGTDAPPFLIMHGLADSSVPHRQSVMLYDALKSRGNEVTIRLVDGLPHTFFNRTDLDDVAGPFQMQVREHPRGGPEAHRLDRAGVFAVRPAVLPPPLAVADANRVLLGSTGFHRDPRGSVPPGSAGFRELGFCRFQSGAGANPEPRRTPSNSISVAPRG